MILASNAARQEPRPPNNRLCDCTGRDSPFRSGRGDAFDERFLRQEEQHQRRQHDQRAGGHQEVPAGAAGLALDLSAFFAVDLGAAVSAESPAGVAVSAASVTAALRFTRGCACLLGFLPSVKISVMRNKVNSWR